MKLLQPILALLSFGTAFGLTCFLKPVASRPPATLTMAETPLPVVSDALPVPLDPAGQLQATLWMPRSPQHDAALEMLSEELLPTDPAAAFRAAMAEWKFNHDMLRAAAEALIKLDPDAARRLVAECSDLRSKRVLEGALMADEVTRNPREKLRWADENLEGYVKQQAVTAGMVALAKLDPAAALEFAATLPPGILKTSALWQALIPSLTQDPTFAAAWMLENSSKSELGQMTYAVFAKFQRENPEAARKLLPNLPPALQEPLAKAIIEQNMIWATNPDPALYAIQSLDLINTLPGTMQSSAIRSMVNSWMEHSGSNTGFPPELLAAITQPEQRVAAVEALMTQRFTVEPDDPLTQSPERAAAEQSTLNLFQTPKDKAAAARIVPYLTYLSPAQQQDLLNRLK